MSTLRKIIVVWALVSVAATVYLVDQKSYGGTPYYLLEYLILPGGITLGLALVALLNNWLDMGGAIVSVAVGFSHSASHMCLLAALLAFFVTSSVATSVGKRAKRRLDPTYKKGGQRNMVQVFSNGAAATTAALGYLLFAPPGSDGSEALSFQQLNGDGVLAVACMAALAGCCGDTWASEFGILQGSNLPRHILTWRAVPAGTNGGVSFVGTVCSILGGLIVGVAFFFGMSVEHLRTGDFPTLAVTAWPAIPLGALAGFVCSLVDSILGATLQYSGLDRAKNCVVNQPGPNIQHISGRDILDNHAVNFLSSLITAVLIAMATYFVFRETVDMPSQHDYMDDIVGGVY